MKENAIRMLCFNIFFESLTVFVLYYQPFFFRFLAKNDKKNSLSEILHFLTPTDIFITINSSHYIIWFEVSKILVSTVTVIIHYHFRKSGKF